MSIDRGGNCPDTLGAYVRQERERAGLSIRQLAHIAGVAASNISRLESNKARYQRPELLKSIANALDLQLETLLRYSYGAEVHPVTTKSRSIASLLRQATDLPDEAVAEAEAAIEEIAKKYRHK